MPQTEPQKLPACPPHQPLCILFFLCCFLGPGGCGPGVPPIPHQLQAPCLGAMEGAPTARPPHRARAWLVSTSTGPAQSRYSQRPGGQNRIELRARGSCVSDGMGPRAGTEVGGPHSGLSPGPLSHSARLFRDCLPPFHSGFSQHHLQVQGPRKRGLASGVCSRRSCADPCWLPWPWGRWV